MRSVRQQGRIDFENVTFRYANTGTDAISNLTLHMESGKTYALVGASGAGKSTILSLILRLYDPTSGAVKIDDRDLRSVTQKSLRERIGSRYSGDVPVSRYDLQQYPVRPARCDAGRSSRSSASRLCTRFYYGPAEGLRNGDWRQRMSSLGGQQQRLAIARAVLKNAPILLLDEATSSLDSESEQQIQKALAKLAAGRTVIAIAHRLSTVLSADQIIVMDGGRIKEIGTHAELLEKSGYYRRLYDHQFNRLPEEAATEPAFAIEELV